MQLSASTRYYIRNLLKQAPQDLTSVVVPGAALRATPDANLDEVLCSLYLDLEEIQENTVQLEALVQVHRQLEESDTQLKNRIEAQVFWILGLSSTDPEFKLSTSHS
jgi:hypothetical protein